MDHIDGFFKKFKGIFANTTHQKEIVASVLTPYLRTSLDQSKVQIKAGIVMVDVNPILKTQIFLHKEKILNELNSKLATKLKDIR